MGDYIFGPPPPPPPKSSTTSNASSSSKYQNRPQQTRQKQQQQQNTNRRTKDQKSFKSEGGSGRYAGQNGSVSGGHESQIQNHGSSSHLDAQQDLHTSGSLDESGSLTSHSTIKKFNLDLVSSQAPTQSPISPTHINPSSTASQFPSSYDDFAADEDDDGGEEKPASKQIVAIPGTSITLQTEADIAKWIAERKARWPTASRVEEKEKEREKARQLQLEQQNLQGEDQQLQDHQGISESTTAKRQPICKFFASTGHCKRGDQCKFLHEQRPATDNKRVATAADGLRTKRYKRFEAPRKMPLFKRLVQNDWDKENEKILDFIAFLAERGIVGKSKALQV
ncbi:nuclear fragile X mental retardation-interacting protein 1-domain-containing protein [Myxozyma melibiosi]|uniref:Nuclear fragile X mental retardation-interacting protein 1-domain-containing protein n=1 Tax=Myxozyma melibiosi TaxID=54550 RepID=A0ABR1F4C0_9ASCO